MVRLFAVFFLAAATSAGAATLEERLAECQEAHSDCKEDCTTSYGTGFKLREKLGVCLNKCTRRNTECRGRHVELDQAGIDEDSFDRKRPVDEATLSRKRAPADAPSIPRRRSERELSPPRAEADEEEAAASAEEDAPAAQPPSRGERPTARSTPDRADTARSAPAREARASTGAPAPSRASDERAVPPSEPEEASQDGVAPVQPAEEDAARSGAKKLMEKGIEEWDPSGE